MPHGMVEHFIIVTGIPTVNNRSKLQIITLAVQGYARDYSQHRNNQKDSKNEGKAVGIIVVLEFHGSDDSSKTTVNVIV
jgi:hypothetical protein